MTDSVHPDQLEERPVLVVDYGAQYAQLIARRVREAGIYSEIVPHSMSTEKMLAKNPAAIVLSGGPSSVYADGAPRGDRALFEAGVPVFGICYGFQVMAQTLGGTVAQTGSREYGATDATLCAVESSFLTGTPQTQNVWMSHGDSVTEAPAGFEVLAQTPGASVAAFVDEHRKLGGVQWHPEVKHSDYGQVALENFLYNIAGLKPTWSTDNIIEEQVAKIREQVGEDRVICALSGGVDSSVAAVMMSKAIGENLTCVFVDHGLLRKDEGDEVEAVFGPNGPYKLNFIRVNAQQRFYDKLKGVTEPEQKRKIIGEEFIRVFEEEAKKIGAVDFLVQGTIYPDVVESGLGGESVVIKSHHNVGGLPDYVDFKEIIEPLRDLFKDEVRKAGLELGIPEKLVFRQPFPGPGLGIRIIGEVTEEKVKIVQEADAIYREEIANAGFDRSISQYFAALTNMRSVGVMGDYRTYDYAIALRAVNTIDFMTAESAEIPYPVLQKVTSRIINEVDHVNRVMYDITSKPPGTIELE